MIRLPTLSVLGGAIWKHKWKDSKRFKGSGSKVCTLGLKSNVRSLESWRSMNSRRLSVCLSSLLLALAMTQYVTAQATISSALLNGPVTDEAGRTIPKANVTIRSLDTNQTSTAVSSETGFYAVPGLPPGRYELAVSSAGFGKYTRTGVELTVGQ